MKRKGEIAVFLALLLSVLSAFTVALTVNARKQLIKSEAMTAMDAAMVSCFAEYNKVCFDKYHIYLIDTSYKGEEGGINRLLDHFAAYMQANMSDVILCDATVLDSEDALWNNSEYLYKMAVNYARRENLPDCSEDTSEELCFVSYLMEICGNCENSVQESVRIGETEYLLYGFECDEDNLKLAEEEYEMLTENFPDNEEVPDYEGFLRNRLENEGILSLRRRFGELVTEYMRENGSPGFLPENSYGYLSVSATVKGSNNREYLIERDYAYETAYEADKYP